MSNSAKITLKIVPFRNKSGSQSWLVTGRVFGEIYQQNFPTHSEAEVFMSGLIRSATQGKNGLPVRMTTTTIADDQDLQAAELAFHRLAKSDYKTRPGWSYRDTWWISHDTHGHFTAYGIHGQGIFIYPDAEMVVVRFASHPIAANASYDATTLPAFDAFAKHLMAITQ